MVIQIGKGLAKLTEAEEIAKGIDSSVRTFWQPKNPTAAEKASMRERVAVLKNVYGQALEELRHVESMVEWFAGDNWGAYWS